MALRRRFNALDELLADERVHDLVQIVEDYHDADPEALPDFVNNAIDELHRAGLWPLAA